MTPLFAALFLSGFCSVLFQEIWTKKAGLVFGHTTLAVTAVVSTFMLGLAIGNALAPHLLRRIQRPIRMYLFAECFVALLGWMLSLLPWSDFPANLAVRVLTLLLLILPAVFMGMTLPAVVSLLGTREARLSARAYFVNTAGAAMAALVGAYVLLPRFSSTAVSVAAALALLAVVPLTWRWRSTVVAPALASQGNEPRIPVRLLLAAFAVGVVGLSQEIAWTRLLSLVFGPSVYAFGSVLFVYLTGIAGGAWVADRIRVRVTRAFLDWNFFATAFFALFGMLIFCLIPYAYVFLVERWSVGFGALRATELFLGALVIAPLAFSQGLLLPCVVFSASSGAGDEPAVLGKLFAANTLGCIVGAAAAALVFIPWVGIQATLFAGAALALLLFLLGAQRHEVPLRAGFAALCVALALGVRSGWDRSVLASGVYKYAVGEILSGNRSVRLDLGSLEFFKEGLSSTVAVISASDDLLLSVDGKVDASMKGDLSTQTLLGALPMSFAQDPKEVLVIGLASGVTSGAALLFDAARVTTVEIEPAVARAQEYFTEINHDPLRDPRHRLLLDDARSFLKNTTDRFDVITSEPSNPWMSGVASLFTREFFSLARSRMSADGVMCQWLPIYGMSDDLVFSIMRTFSSVFPEVAVFESVEGYDLLMLGSATPLRMDPEAVGHRWTPRARAALEKIRIETPEDLIGTYLLSTPFDFPKPARMNTDDFGWVEYHAPKTLHLRTSPMNHAALLGMSAGLDAVLPSGIDPARREAIRKKVSSRGDRVILE